MVVDEGVRGGGERILRLRIFAGGFSLDDSKSCTLALLPILLLPLLCPSLSRSFLLLIWDLCAFAAYLSIADMVGSLQHHK